MIYYYSNFLYCDCSFSLPTLLQVFLPTSPPSILSSDPLLLDFLFRKRQDAIRYQPNKIYEAEVRLGTSPWIKAGQDHPV